MLRGVSRQFGTWARWLAVVASGLLVAGLFAPWDATALVWVALVPLLAALAGLPERRAGWMGFLLGWVAGMVSFGVQLHWLATVSWLGALVLPAYLACFWGLFGAFAATWGHPWRGADPERETEWLGATLAGLGRAFVLASVWAGLEWLRGWLFTGFGWNGLGVAFHDTLVMAQAADLLGVAGLSWLVVFFQALLLQAGRRIARGAADGRKRPRLDFGLGALAVGLVLAYGLVRMATLGSGESVRLRALLVQNNIPQDAAVRLWPEWKIHLAYEEQTAAAFEALAAEDAARLERAAEAADEGEEAVVALRSPHWVIWPESALSGRILRTEDGKWGTWQENQVTFLKVREAAGMDFHLIFGAHELEAESLGRQLLARENGRAFNSLAVLPPDDQLITYRKRHLVIFGEYIPFVEQIPLLKRIYEQQSGAEYGGAFSRGDSTDPLEMEVAGRGVGVIPSVCFEDTVPRLARRFVREGPQVIVNVTNDGWFKESAAAAQHFANARFRAIELRRPMVRAANTGISAAVDVLGSTRHPEEGGEQVLRDPERGHFTQGWLLAELDVPLDPPGSLYARIGDSGIIALGLAGLGGGWFAARRRKKAA